MLGVRVLPASGVLDNNYLYYWFQGVREEIINLASGGGQPNISQATVAIGGVTVCIWCIRRTMREIEMCI